MAAVMLTLVDLLTKLNDGVLLKIAEVLTEDRPLLADAPFKRANGIESHKGVRRKTLPKAELRKINQGVGTGKSESEPVTDNMSTFQTYSKIDEKLVKMSPNPKQYLTDEELAFIDGLGEQAEEKLLYGTSAGDEMEGFLTRLNSTSLENVTSAGGTGTGAIMSSILIVSWHETECHALYPRNAEENKGISRRYQGVRTVKDSAGKDYEAHVSLYEFSAGIHIKEPKRVHRICNIKTDGMTEADMKALRKLIRKVLNRMKSRGKGAVMYCDEDVLSLFEDMADDKTIYDASVSDVGGIPTTHFKRVPVKLCQSMVKETVIA